MSTNLLGSPSALVESAGQSNCLPQGSGAGIDLGLASNVLFLLESCHYALHCF